MEPYSIHKKWGLGPNTQLRPACRALGRFVARIYWWLDICSLRHFVAGTFCNGSFCLWDILYLYWFSSRHYHKVIQGWACYSSSCQWWRALFSGISIFNNYIKRSAQPGICKGGGDCCIHIIGRMGLLSKYSYTLWVIIVLCTVVYSQSVVYSQPDCAELPIRDSLPAGN